MGTFFIVP